MLRFSYGLSRDLQVLDFRTLTYLHKHFSLKPHPSQKPHPNPPLSGREPEKLRSASLDIKYWLFHIVYFSLISNSNRSGDLKSPFDLFHSTLSLEATSFPRLEFPAERQEERSGASTLPFPGHPPTGGQPEKV